MLVREEEIDAELRVVNNFFPPVAFVNAGGASCVGLVACVGSGAQAQQRSVGSSNAGGSVASHGSVAVFGRANRRMLEEISIDEVIDVKEIVEHQV